MSTEPTPRKRVGRPFTKGMSGNPLGRPKEHAAVKALAQQYGERSIKLLAEIAFGKHQAEYKDAKGKTRKRRVYDEPAATRAMAAEKLLDRGYGKPAQCLDMPIGDPSLKVQITRIERVFIDMPIHDDDRLIEQ